MKKWAWIFLFVFCVPRILKAQSEEAEQLLLDLQKLLQLRQILADLKKGYTIVYKGYSTIKDISKGNFNLHKNFLDGLLDVSPAVKHYRKVADIISLQLNILSEYKVAFRQFKESGTFSPSEIDYIGKVYSNLFDNTIENIKTLSMIISSGTLRMSDDERLTQIDALHKDMSDKLSFLRHFNRQTALLSLQRTREANEINFGKKIYGLSY